MRFCILFLFLSVGFQYSQAQTPTIGGVYYAQTGTVANTKFKIYTYLRLYIDGTAIEQTVNSEDAHAVSKWFGWGRKYSMRGRYDIDGGSVKVHLSNDGTPDAKLEGAQTRILEGTLHDGKLCLADSGNTQKYCYQFLATNDTTTFKFSENKPMLTLPGDWRYNGVNKESRQVFFRDERGTGLAVTILDENALDETKDVPGDYVKALAYYHWQADYLSEEPKMTVKMLKQAPEKGFLIWEAEVSDSPVANTFLMACNNHLLFNFMLFNQALPQESRMKMLEAIYHANK
ncbi:hypothetical protein [Chitinophaga sp. Cy-1792]|uniref:hypothetical protein n=1 Tax=Chitinophaga sp. Cy-1792 TaxID=2608339 RepID=UPI00141DA79B|nr:hypothetical protein [Chitinophaga sp. Cy-1792]NIG56505.1 hypothetical protein [Chitinophaga sp. Cy-1792]